MMKSLIDSQATSDVDESVEFETTEILRLLHKVDRDLEELKFERKSERVTWILILGHVVLMYYALTVDSSYLITASLISSTGTLGVWLASSNRSWWLKATRGLLSVVAGFFVVGIAADLSQEVWLIAVQLLLGSYAVCDILMRWLHAVSAAPRCDRQIEPLTIRSVMFSTLIIAVLSIIGTRLSNLEVLILSFCSGGVACTVVLALFFPGMKCKLIATFATLVLLAALAWAYRLTGFEGDFATLTLQAAGGSISPAVTFFLLKKSGYTFHFGDPSPVTT